MMAESNTGELSGHAAAMVGAAVSSNNKKRSYDESVVSETQHMKQKLDDIGWHADETEWYGEEESRIAGT